MCLCVFFIFNTLFGREEERKKTGRKTEKKGMGRRIYSTRVGFPFTIISTIVIKEKTEQR